MLSDTEDHCNYIAYDVMEKHCICDHMVIAVNHMAHAV